MVDSVVIYWDSSAVLSALFKDRHSDDAHVWAHRTGFHAISTLSYSEVCAVIARLQRERQIPDVFAVASFETLDTGPWRYLTIAPDAVQLRKLSEKWPLRGADLWHLSTAVTLKKQLPELVMLTYDNRLKEAAAGEGLA